MRFLGVATDYDGTLAHEGRVEPSVLNLLEAVRSSGRKLILVTGRHLPDLQIVFPHLATFDLVVAENGALLYNPSTREEELLSKRIPGKFVRELRIRGLAPVSVGRGIVAARRSQARLAVDAIRELGLDLEVIFNKDSAMVLPFGINKGTGLKAALRELNFSADGMVGLGDAENDYDFLRLCGCSVAVANALDSIKESVDIVTRGEDGEGVSEILEALLRDDLAEYQASPGRHRLQAR